MARQSFYYEQKNGEEVIKEELLTTKAEAWAKNFVRARPSLTSAQIRRFYHDVKALQAKIEAAGDVGFTRNRPLIKMLKSKVAYACPQSYKGRKVPMEFRSFMEECIDAIEEEKDFDAFSLVFEAVIGYFYGLGGVRDE